MRLKPKSTTLSPRALLYKRFIGLEKSLNLQTIYSVGGKYWSFDSQALFFIEISSDLIPQTSTIVQVEPIWTILQYQGTYFRYNDATNKWETIDLSVANIPLLSASFGNIAKYQTNKYYYVGSFDYMLKGAVEGTTTQFIKGNIIPLTSLNIKHFNDSINISPDDLVVISGKLFSVENTTTDHKHQPKDYTIHFATLNSVL